MNATAICYNSGCHYQPNAAALPDGSVVFDACGECEACRFAGTAEGPTLTRIAPPESRPATGEEIAAQKAAIDALYT